MARTQPVAAGVAAEQSNGKARISLLQANVLVAMLGGFWARQADGHPGPDLMARGLVLLRALVEWEAIKSRRVLKPPRAKEARHKPG